MKDGTVKAPKIIEDTNSTDQFRKCFINTFNKIRFPKLVDVDSLDIEQTYNFNPKKL